MNLTSSTSNRVDLQNQTAAIKQAQTKFFNLKTAEIIFILIPPAVQLPFNILYVQKRENVKQSNSQEKNNYRKFFN